MPRQERVDDEICKQLNRIIARELKDPRLSTLVSVTGVNVSKDLKTAKAFVSVFEKDKEKDVLNALAGASSHIRGMLFDCLKIRLVPHITFVPDHSMENGDKIDKLIKKIHEDENK